MDAAARASYRMLSEKLLRAPGGTCPCPCRSKVVTCHLRLLLLHGCQGRHAAEHILAAVVPQARYVYLKLVAVGQGRTRGGSKRGACSGPHELVAGICDHSDPCWVNVGSPRHAGTWGPARVVRPRQQYKVQTCLSLLWGRRAVSSGCPQLQASMLRHGSPQLEGLHLLMSRLTTSKAPSQGAFSVRAAERCTWCGMKATTRKAWREPVLASDSPSSPCWPHVLLSLLRRTHACLVTGNRGLMIDGVPLSASGSPQAGPPA